MCTRGVATRRGRPSVTAAVVALSLLALGVSASCSATPPARSTASASATGTPPTTTPSSAARPGATTPAMRTTAPRPQTSPPPTTRRATTVASCGQRLAATMTPAQRAGQLLMVGLQPTMSSRALAAQVRAQGIGGVIYVGGWYSGTASVATVSERLQAAAAGHLLIAADQEGGSVQQLRGAGFSRIPSARTQATTGTVAEERDARLWSRQLGAAGVNVNLAPVADTVPSWLGAGNAPIGHYARDFAPGDPLTNGRYAAAFVRGTLAAGIAPTAKHFPGLGRVRGNTDTTSQGITDTTTSATDPYLASFRAAIAAGVPLVMVSSAFYPRLDRVDQAVFSAPVVTGLLRQRMGFGGVVVSDDLGSAASVAGVPVGQRATRFVAAGGDIVLTTVASQAPVMVAALLAKRAASPAFAARLDASAARVLDLKARLRLVHCP
ncbi:MAG: glycoside hydrolase family 3 N-terminal domain-containing protein [Nocardioides sp.]